MYLKCTPSVHLVCDWSLPLVYERFHYRAPGSNVVVAARLRGHIDPDRLHCAARCLAQRHPLLLARIESLEDGSAVFRPALGTDFDIQPVDRREPFDWCTRALEAQQAPFDLDTGPLVKFALIHGTEATDLVVICHHTICDGRSLVELLKELIAHLGDSTMFIGPQLSPPQVLQEHFPKAPRARLVERLAIRSINQRWKATGIRFDQSDYLRLHRRYWDSPPNVLVGSFTPGQTRRLVTRCRDEHVTANTALCAAFLSAQHRVQGTWDADHRRLSMAVDLRRYMMREPDPTLGLCASGFTVNTRLRTDESFWRQTRTLHEMIRRCLSSPRTVLAMLSLNRLHPTLIDALQFGMHGSLASPALERLLKTMRFNGVRFGLAVTNLGRVEIPESSGSIDLMGMWFVPPAFPNLEKVLGVVTVHGQLKYTLTYYPTLLPTCVAEGVRSEALAVLRRAVGW